MTFVFRCNAQIQFSKWDSAWIWIRFRIRLWLRATPTKRKNKQNGSYKENSQNYYGSRQI